MPHAKPASLRKTQTKAVTLLGVAGALSLVAGASAVGPAVDTPTENTPPLITHGEEEISDVSLATFYVFDNENAGTHHPGLQLIRERGLWRQRNLRRWRRLRCGGGYGCGGGPTGGGGPDGM